MATQTAVQDQSTTRSTELLSNLFGKKSNHQANIVRIAEVKPHPNADRLEVIPINGYQLISQKGTFEPGDLAVFVQPDSVVPQTEPFKFIWGPYALAETAKPSVFDPLGLSSAPVPERNRRITVKRLRGEYSEGLLLSVFEFEELFKSNCPIIQVGDDVSDLLGITYWDPDKGVENTNGENTNAPRYRRPKTLRGWFHFLLRKLGFKRTGTSVDVSFEAPVYDVEAFKNYKNVFTAGEGVIVTEKIHGSNARYVYLDGTMYAGSRTLWKSPKSNCVWRKALDQNPWIELLCKANPGYILYGEVTPTQKGFDYGNEEGEVRFFLFDIRTPSGRWLQQSEYHELNEAKAIDWYRVQVPLMYIGPFSEHLTSEAFVGGQSYVLDVKHMREGVVIRSASERWVPGLGRPQLKVVSNAFLEKDNK